MTANTDTLAAHAERVRAAQAAAEKATAQRRATAADLQRVAAARVHLAGSSR